MTVELAVGFGLGIIAAEAARPLLASCLPSRTASVPQIRVIPSTSPEEDWIAAFRELKQRGKGFVTYKLDKTGTKVVLDVVSNDGDLSALVKSLPAEACAFATVVVEFDAGDGAREKIIFAEWVPEEAKIREKVVYSAKKDSLRNPLVGVNLDVKAEKAEELDYRLIVEKLMGRSPNRK